MKRVIPTYVHGFIDYIGAVVLFFFPEIFEYSGVGGAAEIVPRTIGVLILVQSLITDYELGAFDLISMRTHLINDYIAALFLAFSPWLFGFRVGPANQWIPHLMFGLGFFAVSLLTSTEPLRAAVAPHLFREEDKRDSDRPDRHVGNF